MSESKTEPKKSGLSRDHIFVTLTMIAVVFAVVAILGKGLNLNPNSRGVALIGKKAFDFEVELIQGTEHSAGSNGMFKLSDYLGKPVVINFWASWCVSCREEAVVFENQWKKYQNSGLQVIGIAVQDTKKDALRFANYFGKTYLLALDKKGRIGIDYGVTGVPETFFVDANGIIVHKVAGPVTQKDWDQSIIRILSK